MLIVNEICSISIFEVLFQQMFHIRTSMIEFTLEKLKAGIVQSAILIFTAFNTGSKNQQVPKVSCFGKNILTKKSLWCRGF